MFLHHPPLFSNETINSGDVECKRLSLDWKPFGISCSSKFCNLYAITSFEPNYNNYIRIYHNHNDNKHNKVEVKIKYPQSSCMFSPTVTSQDSDFLITSGDNLKIWKYDHNNIELFSEIKINSTKDPVTCQDWSTWDPNMAIVGATDGATVAVDLANEKIGARILAHDYPIHDVKFYGPTPMFLTVSFDGSLRFFDLRNLESSFIYYQAPLPLMRVSVSLMDETKVATFFKDSDYCIIIDIRKPGVPCGFCSFPGEKVTCLQWSKFERNVLFVSTDKGNIYQSYLNEDNIKMQSLLFYKIDEPIESFVIGNEIAVSSKNHVNLIDFATSQQRNELLF